MSHTLSQCKYACAASICSATPREINPEIGAVLGTVFVKDQLYTAGASSQMLCEARGPENRVPAKP